MGIQFNRGNNKTMNDKPDDSGFFARLIAFIRQSSIADEYRPSKHINRNKCQLSENFIRKLKAKKKRKRKISYQSRLNHKFGNKKQIKI